MAESHDGWYWAFPNMPGRIMRFHPEKNAQEVVAIENYIFPLFLLDTPDKIWLGQRMGRGIIQIFEPSTGKIHEVDVQVEGLPFLPALRVKSMLRDQSGSIWIGTEMGPLLKFEPQHNQFHWLQFRAGSANTLSHNWVISIQKGLHGHYWMATFGGGLNRWDRKKNLFTPDPATGSLPAVAGRGTECD